MPIIDGFKAIEMLQQSEITKHIPILVLSCVNENDFKKIGSMEGISDYLTKPDDFERLLEAVKNIVPPRH